MDFERANSETKVAFLNLNDFQQIVALLTESKSQNESIRAAIMRAQEGIKRAQNVINLDLNNF